MNGGFLSVLREWFGAKNNKHLALLIVLDVVFFSLFGYVAYQASDPKGWCIMNSGIPYDVYKENFMNNTYKNINWTLINSAQ